MNFHLRTNKKKEMGNKKYSCSMHCEGNKTYDPGDCPVCGMHLVTAGSGGGGGHSCC